MRAFGVASLLLITVLILTTIGLAVPSVNLNVQEIGSGSGDVTSPVEWGRLWITYYRSGGVRYVDRVYLTLSDDVLNASVYVTLRTTTGANYTRELHRSTIRAGELLVFDFSNESIRKGRLNTSATSVTVVDGLGPPGSSGSIDVLVQEVGIGKPVPGSGCVLVNITERSGETLYNYSVRVQLRGNDLDWDTANESNIYVSALDGSPIYFWIKSYDEGNRRAVLWIKVPELPASGYALVCVNYGVWPNPYRQYNDLKRAFLYVDTFDFLNTSIWSLHGSPETIGGELVLEGGEWIWSGKGFGNHYALHLAAVLEPDNGTTYKSSGNRRYSLGPFIIALTDDSGTFYGEGIGRMYRGTTKRKRRGLLHFPSSGAPEDGDWANLRRSRYRFSREVYLFMTFYDGKLTFQQKTVDSNWDSIEVGNWERYFGFRNGYNQVGSSTVPAGQGTPGLGQWCGGPSRYGWLIVRNYVQREPQADVAGEAYLLSFEPSG